VIDDCVGNGKVKKTTGNVCSENVAQVPAGDAPDVVVFPFYTTCDAERRPLPMQEQSQQYREIYEAGYDVSKAGRCPSPLKGGAAHDRGVAGG
jgi:hypothetical protein